MNRRTFLATAPLAAFAPAFAGAAERYEPSWDSLDSHQCPSWFRDAKLGMYFHWGLSSVPGWAPRTEGISYAEWYWHAMNDSANPTNRYHRETWGQGFAYDDFIPLWRAEWYDPAAWVDFAKKSGMKYMFVNAKHHDGFCTWPTKLTRRNAFDMGPRRDLIGPLVKAARDSGLKMGFYYSFYEWYNPLYTGTPMPYAGLIPHEDYVDGFMIPQIHELIELYDPDFMYFDGEWDQPPEFWKSRELVAWYYNRAARNNQEVLVNDRYGRGKTGRGSRGVHGDVFNVEYHFDNDSLGALDHQWSYWRGIAKTFGYNRDTDPADCLTPKDLIHMVVDGVALNGNFDINVGPTAEGLVTDVERYPLLELGTWLTVNGEAIYGTRPWTTPASGDVRFTVKGADLYATFLSWQGTAFHVPGVRPVPGSEIVMLGTPGTLTWRQVSDGVVIDYPVHRARPTHCAWAWTFRMRIES